MIPEGRPRSTRGTASTESGFSRAARSAAKRGSRRASESTSREPVRATYCSNEEGTPVSWPSGVPSGGEEPPCAASSRSAPSRSSRSRPRVAPAFCMDTASTRSTSCLVCTSPVMASVAWERVARSRSRSATSTVTAWASPAPERTTTSGSSASSWRTLAGAPQRA
jgi:hypothetical protein